MVQNRDTQMGYTIIELMIVVVIIGILGALAIPSYLSYTTKSQITDGIALIGNLKTAVAEHYNSTQQFPANRGALGLGLPGDTQGEYVSQVDVENGQLVITFGNAASGDIATQVLTMRPYTDVDRNISWFCGTATPPAGLTAGGVWTQLTNVSSEYLPSNCRT